MTDILKLYAIDPEDLTVMSAALEGAITSPGEISYSAKSRQLTLTSSRMRWEKMDATTQEGSRIRCGVLFTDVTAIRAKSIPQNDQTLGMELLSVQCTSGDDGRATLSLVFADNRTLELNVECFNAALTDVGEPWTTDKIPNHKLED